MNLQETMMGKKSLNKTSTPEEVNRQVMGRGGRRKEGKVGDVGMLTLDGFVESYDES